MSFEMYLQHLEFSPSTIKRYLSFEKEFISYFSIENKSTKGLDYNDLLSYVNAKQESKPKRSTMVLLLGRIQQYYNYLGLENPIQDFRLKGYEQPNKPPILTANQLKQIAVVYHQNKRLGLVSKVALSLLIYQGLSTHELPLLCVEHLDLQQGEITIPSSRLETRTIALEASQIFDLMQLTEEKDLQASLLEYQGSKHLQNRHSHWKAQVKRELQKNRLPISFINLGQFRNSRIAHWIKDLGILHAQYLAGHHRLGATQAYQAEDHEALRATFTQLHPFF